MSKLPYSITTIPKGWNLFKLQETASNERYSFTGGPFGSNLKASDYRENGVRIIQLQNIGDGKFLNNYQIFTSEEKADELSSCNIFPGDIILSKMGDPVARATFIPEYEDRYVMASDGIRLNVNEEIFDKYFVLSFINSKFFRNNAVKQSTGSTRQRIGLNDLRQLPIIAPPIEEQRAIADILGTWDEAIALTESLISALNTRKKGLMQKLLTGEVRFSEFDGEWERKAIYEIGAVVTGTTPSTKNPDYYGDERLFISPADLGTDKYITQSVKLLSELGFERTRPVRKGSTLFTSIGSTIGKTGMAGVELATNQQINSVVPFHNIDDEYIYYVLTYLAPRIALLAGKQAVPIINKTTFENEVIPLPPKKSEQNKISSIIVTVDNTVALYRKYAVNLKQQKKGLMQQLLTGQVRVGV